MLEIMAFPGPKPHGHPHGESRSESSRVCTLSPTTALDPIQALHLPLKPLGLGSGALVQLIMSMFRGLRVSTARRVLGLRMANEDSIPASRMVPQAHQGVSSPTPQNSVCLMFSRSCVCMQAPCCAVSGLICYTVFTCRTFCVGCLVRRQTVTESQHPTEFR